MIFVIPAETGILYFLYCHCEEYSTKQSKFRLPRPRVLGLAMTKYDNQKAGNARFLCDLFFRIVIPGLTRNPGSCSSLRVLEAISFCPACAKTFGEHSLNAAAFTAPLGAGRARKSPPKVSASARHLAT